jgi:hypothetical protein
MTGALFIFGAALGGFMLPELLNILGSRSLTIQVGMNVACAIAMACMAVRFA